MESTSSAATDTPRRRNFLVQASAVVIGALVGVFPAIAGIQTWLDPLLRRKDPEDEEQMIRVTTLDSMPEIGKVYRFPIIAERTDAWTKHPPGRVGAVYLRRPEQSPDRPIAFTHVCPHLGCSVEHKDEVNQFHCPCHNSKFELDGARIEPSASPRDLDSLAVDVKDGQVWIAFKNFRSGIADKVEES